MSNPFSLQLNRIRRFLRDPDGYIWSDALINTVWNDVQQEFFNQVGRLQDVKVIKLPPWFAYGYLYDWETGFRCPPVYSSTYCHSFESDYVFDDSETTEQVLGYDTRQAITYTYVWETDRNSSNAFTYASTVPYESWDYNNDVYENEYPTYHALKFYDPENMKICYRWEAESLEGYTAATTEDGDQYTNPWEAWMISTAAMNPPIILPDRCHNIIAIYWDKKPLVATDYRQIIDDDPSWRTQSGEPSRYWRDDLHENVIHLYSIPSTVTWASATVDVGQGDPEEYADYDDDAYLDMDDNLCVIFEKNPRDIDSPDDIPDGPDYVWKYISYKALERLYTLNSDGKIESLRDYWAWRAKLGLEAMKMFNLKRHRDKQARLRTRGVPYYKTRKRPRLPDGYPAQW